LSGLGSEVLGALDDDAGGAMTSVGVLRGVMGGVMGGVVGSLNKPRGP